MKKALTQPVPIVAVVVLYRRRLVESETYRSLKAAIESGALPRELVGVLVYDNSPEPSARENLDFVDHFEHHPDNPGLSAAYNRGCSIARDCGASWLLLLDQDSQLPESYVSQVLELTTIVSSNVSALVPRVWSEKHLVSPQRTVFSVAPGILPVRKSGKSRNVTAINSGAVLRLRFLESIGGFPAEFPIEFLDHYMFAKLREQGDHVWVMDVDVHHDLSVARFESAITLERYERILDAEFRFYWGLRNRSAKVLYSSMLMYRSAKFALVPGLRKFLPVTLSCARRNLSKLSGLLGF